MKKKKNLNMKMKKWLQSLFCCFRFRKKPKTFILLSPTNSENKFQESPTTIHMFEGINKSRFCDI